MRVGPNFKWWLQADWSLTNGEIAKRAGATPYRVRKKRAELGVSPHPRGKRPGIYGLNPSKIDWTKPDADIARELGISHQAVWQRRRLVGQPVVKNKRKPRAIDWSALDWSKSNHKLAREIKINRATVSEQRKQCTGLPSNRRSQSIDFSQLDWSKTDDNLSKEVGLSRSSMQHYRKILGYPSHPTGKRRPNAPSGAPIL